jgi:effector protein B
MDVLELMMLIYQGKELTKFKSKEGGKNRNDVDGFYADSNGVEYFIKKPQDARELFTELFAGLLLQEFKSRGLIEKIYHSSLICAQLIQFEDGSYGLIQPKVEFQELYKVIGTGYHDGSDRDPLWEMFYGPHSYLLLTQLKQYYGLAIALMFSLLLGDHSVHSGNVVCFDILSSMEEPFIQFARIDWGAAFRYYGHKKNNDDLLYPFEYQGFFNHKGYTKGYFLNYKRIKGLFPAIAAHAKQFLEKINKETLVSMMNSILGKLPADLMDNDIKEQLAKYLYIESFKNISFGETGDYQQFANDLSEILLQRLNKMTALSDFTNNLVEPNQPDYKESAPITVGLPLSQAISFAEQMNLWLHVISLSDEKSIFDFNNIDRSQLAAQFNRYLENLLRQVEQLDCANDTTKTKFSKLSHPNSALYRDLFSFEADLKPVCSPENEPTLSPQAGFWQLTEALLKASFNVLITLRVLQETQNSTTHTKAAAIHFLFDALKEYLNNFNHFYQDFLSELEKTHCLFPDTQHATLFKLCK